MKTIGIMGAMEEEIAGIRTLLENPSEIKVASRIFSTGFIKNQPVVLVFSRWGKVAAASTASSLIHHFGVDEILFTGVAGALDPKLNIGDVVLGNKMYQHDMDASPFLEPFEIPYLKARFFEPDKNHLARAVLALENLLTKSQLDSIFSPDVWEKFNLERPKWTLGDIASGDRFINGEEEKTGLQKKLPEVKCVEMEGAAVAQVCHEHQIPWTIIRIISDAANQHSHVDFQSFIKEIAAQYSREIIKQYFEPS